MFQLSERSKRHLDGVNPELVEVVKLAIQLTKVDFGIPITGGYRTPEQQRALYDANKSQRDGYQNRSHHQTGKAVDVFAYVDGKASYDMGDLAQVAAAMLEAGHRLGVSIRWGGLWKSFVDGPHFELAR